MVQTSATSDARGGRAGAPPARPGARAVAGLALLLVALGVAYAPVLDADFVSYDDDKYVTANAMVQGGLTREGVARAFGEFHDANWIPLVWISLMIDHELHGLDAGGYHATNLLLHALATLLLFAACLRLTRAPWRSLFVAGVFALHPLHVQSVAWVAERKDVLSGVFWMAALLAWSFWVERRTVVRFAAVLAAMALGLMAKATLVTLPFVLLLLDVWPTDRLWSAAREGVALPRRALVLVAEKLPLFALSVLASLVTLSAQGGAIQSARIELPARIANALVAWWLYVRKTLWPSDLAFFYPYSARDLASPEVLAAGAALLGATAAALVALARSERVRPLGVGWLWFVGTLVPMIGIVQVGGQAMADRYTYVPLVGLAITAAWAIPAAAVARRPALRAVCGALLVASLLACAVATRAEVRHWRDSEALYTRAIALDRDNYVAHYELARHLNGRERYARAEAHAREAVRLIPQWADAYLNLGVALAGQDRHDEAITAFRRALARQPASFEGRAALASTLIEAGRFEEARSELLRLVQQSPGNPGVRISLASIEEKLGDREAALHGYDQVWRATAPTGDGSLAAARIAVLVDAWPEAPARWVRRAREAATALAPLQPDPFEAMAERLGERARALDAAAAEEAP